MKIRTPAVVWPSDVVTGRPPPAPPAMRLLGVAGGTEIELPWTARPTASGGVVFDGFEVYESNPPAVDRDYRLVVRADPALRPEQPAGYLFTVPKDFAAWPVKVPVTLLPGPAYPFLPQVPVLHGRVLRPSAEPLPDTEVAVLLADGTVTARGLTDSKGRFSVGVVRQREGRALVLSAADVERPLVAADFHRSIDLIIP